MEESGAGEAEQRTAAEALLHRLVAPAASALPLPRLLLVFAHPDDEVLSVGGRLERLANGRLLTLTDGAPMDGGDARDHGFSTLNAYRQARRGELSKALADASLRDDFVVPFSGVADQDAAMHLPELTRAVGEQLLAFQPEAVLTHPYEGGHPDHDACAFVVHNAARLCAGRDSGYRPVILESPFYHAGPGGTMQTSTFLPEAKGGPCVDAALSLLQVENKRRRLACFASQATTLAQFGVEREIFRVAPLYDFQSEPHTGRLLYEHFGWGMTGERFRRLASEALFTLFPDAAPQAAMRDTGLTGGRC